MDRRRSRMRVLPGQVLMRIVAVDELTVLGALRMPDQEHVASARALRE